MSKQKDLIEALEALKNRIIQQSSSHGWALDVVPSQQVGWNAPSLSIRQVAEYINLTIDRAAAINEKYFEAEAVQDRFEKINQSISFQNAINIPNDPDAVMGSVMMLLQFINANIPNPRPAPPKVDWEDVRKDSTVPKDLARRLRSVVSRLEFLEPQSEQIAEKIKDIEDAHAAAEQLPTDLEELASQRDRLMAIIDESLGLSQTLVASGDETTEQSRKVLANIERLADEASEQQEAITNALLRAEGMISRSEQALRGATGVGLANAFETRKASLTKAGYFWVVGLVASLVTGLFIGQERVTALRDVLKADQANSIIWINAMLALIGVAGPIWFAWLSTKQIWTNSRLAEDYAFKASVSKAYEGYRKEAIELDPSLRQRLFATALARIEEAPIRLMEPHSHSTPLQELLANPAMLRAMESVPDMAGRILAIVKGKDGLTAAALVGTATSLAAATAQPVVELEGRSSGSRPENGD